MQDPQILIYSTIVYFWILRPIVQFLSDRLKSFLLAEPDFDLRRFLDSYMYLAIIRIGGSDEHEKYIAQTSLKSDARRSQFEDFSLALDPHSCIFLQLCIFRILHTFCCHDPPSCFLIPHLVIRMLFHNLPVEARI